MQGHRQVIALLLAGFAVTEETHYHLPSNLRMLGAVLATEVPLPFKH